MEINLEQEKLGEMLIEHEVIDQEELDRALEFQENVGGKLGEILIKLGHTTEETILGVIAQQQNMDTVDLSEQDIREDLIEEIPREVIESHEVIPVGLDGETLQLAIHDPYDFESLEEVGLATNYSIEPLLASKTEILKSIDRLYYRQDEFEEEEKETVEKGSSLDLSTLNTPALLQGLIDVLVEEEVISEEQLKEMIREKGL